MEFEKSYNNGMHLENIIVGEYLIGVNVFTLHQNLTCMIRTNMISDHFLVIQSYMPCFCA
jgi:hypothetical protein